MAKQGILERHSSWIIPIIAACVAGLGVFYSVQGDAGNALTIAKENKAIIKKHCENDVIIRRETAEKISEINVNLAEIRGDMNSINVLIEERYKQDRTFKQRILQELERIK